MDSAVYESPFELAPQRRWQIPEDYSYLDELDARGLAWEFMRRSKDYQRDYWDWRQKDLHAHTNRHERSGSQLALEAHALLDALCERWRLIRSGGPRHPDSYMAPYFDDLVRPRLPDSGGQWLNGEYSGIGWGPLDYHTAIAVRIYYDLPLEQQLNEVRHMFERFRKQWQLPSTVPRSPASINLRQDKYPLYIRVLDAVSDEATNSEMAEIFWPNEFRNRKQDTQKKVHDTKKAAVKMADQGYINIFHTSLRK